MNDVPADDLFAEGISLIKSGDVDKASDIFSELVEKDEKNHKAWNAYGVALSQTTHIDSAIHCFENALALDPQNPVYRRNLLRISSHKKRLKPNYHKDELTLQPGSTRLVPLLAIVFIGIVAVTIGAMYAMPGLFPFSLPFSATDQDDLPVGPSELNFSNTSIITVIPTPTPVITPVPTPPPPPVLFHFIDVSQGDAALVQSGGKNMLIDAGPFHAGSRLVEYLKAQNVTRLDLVIASHPFDDHIGGMQAIFSAFPVDIYIDNGQPYQSQTYDKVTEMLRSGTTNRTFVAAGMKIPFDDRAVVDVIRPFTFTGHPDEDSLILKVTVGDISVIFPGDAQEVRTTGTILKAPDHGSDKAVNAIRNVRPEAVVISVASGNRFEYPRSATLSMAKEVQAEVYRTDINGTIVISTDGTSWEAVTSR